MSLSTLYVFSFFFGILNIIYIYVINIHHIDRFYPLTDTEQNYSLSVIINKLKQSLTSFIYSNHRSYGTDRYLQARLETKKSLIWYWNHHNLPIYYFFHPVKTSFSTCKHQIGLDHFLSVNIDKLIILTYTEVNPTLEKW